MRLLYDQIVLFGDSITEFCDDQERGFNLGPALRNDYSRRLEVINRGLSGYNTDHALRVVKYILPPPDQARVRLMTIFFGANDSCVRLAERNQCVDLPVFEKNLIKLIQHPAVVAHAPALVLVTPPPIDERLQRAVDASKGYPVRRSAETTRAYAAKVRQVGGDLGVPVVDLWTRFVELAGWKEGDYNLPGSVDLPPNEKFAELMHDGLHLAPLGYQVFYDELRSCISTNFPELVPDKLPMALPVWDAFPEHWTGPAH